jgi:hypothetical protein
MFLVNGLQRWAMVSTGIQGTELSIKHLAKFLIFSFQILTQN